MIGFKNDGGDTKTARLAKDWDPGEAFFWRRETLKSWG